MDETVQDFGEYLVDIRDRLDRPLPLRVRSGWIVFGACLESFCIGLLILMRCEYRSVLSLRVSGPEPDLDELVREFSVLDGVPSSREQTEQARRNFHEQAMRRCDRALQELEMWTRAMRSGMFLGSLLIALLGTSALMSSVTGHSVWAIKIGLALALLQAAGVAVCLRGWHLP